MTCEQASDRLSSYVDEELDAAASARLERHVASCASCARELDRLRELGQFLRAAVENHRASDLLRERIRRALPPARAEKRWRAPRWVGVAASAAVVAGAAWLGPTWPGERDETAIAHEAAAAHIRSLMGDHLTDVVSSDEHTVKPWFAGRVDFSPEVTDLAAAGYPLAGGRLEYLHGRPVAALVYLRRKHVINAFLWPASSGRERSVETELSEQGYHVLHGERRGMTFWIVSDLDREELGAFARLLIGP